MKETVSFGGILFAMVMGFFMGSCSKEQNMREACKYSGSYYMGPKEVLDCKVRTP